MNRDQDLEAFCAFFNKLDKTCTRSLDQFYTDDVVFIDPLHRIEGISALKQYFFILYENVTACRFQFHERVRDGDKAFVTWTMTLVHHRLARGQEVAVEGCSQLTFASDGSGRVARHRDYFDVGAMLYEQLPLIGAVVRRIKRQLG